MFIFIYTEKIQYENKLKCYIMKKESSIIVSHINVVVNQTDNTRFRLKYR